MINSETYAFTDNNLSQTLDTKGVYELIEHGETIYFGRAMGGSVTIKTRLQAHKRGSEGPGTQRATHYRRMECADPAAMEVQLLTAFRARYGRLPRENQRVG